MDEKYRNLSKDNEDLQKLIRNQVNEALDAYQYKFTLWIECFLEFHGISMRQHYRGDSFYILNIPDETGALKSRKIYERPTKLRNIYTAVKFALGQVNKASPDFIANVGDFTIEGIAQTYAQLIKNEWRRAKVDSEMDHAWINHFIFGEMVLRNYYVEEKRERHFKLVEGESKKDKDMVNSEWYKVDKTIYKGCKAKFISSLNFMPSPENSWIDIQDAPWVATRVLKTPEEILDLFPDDFDSEEDVRSKCVGSHNRDILNPMILIKELYQSKLDPETKEYLFQATEDLGINSNSILTDDLIEVIEYDNKSLDAHAIMIGDYLQDVGYMESDNYPYTFSKANSDSLTPRGISDVEQALPLSKTADDIFDIKLKNYALQLSLVILYNKNYFQDTPTFEPGSALGIDVPVGTNLNEAMTQLSKYSQNFEIVNEQRDIEQKGFLTMGMNPQILGGFSSSTETTAREAVIRQAASTSALDDTVKRTERNVYSDIANQFSDFITLFYEDDFLFALKNDNETRYVKFLAGVTITDKDKYYIYNYKGNLFYEPKKNENMIEEIIEEMSKGVLSLSNEVVAGDFTLPEATSVPLANKTEVDEKNKLGVDEDVIGSWSEFVNKIVQRTNNKIQYVITRADFDTFKIKFDIEAVQGIKLNKQIMADNLMKLLPFLTAAQQNPAMMPYIKYLLMLNDVIPEKVLGELAKMANQPQAVLKDDKGNVVAQGQQAIQAGGQTPVGEAMRMENLQKQDPNNSNINNPSSVPLNAGQTTNPSGL